MSATAVVGEMRIFVPLEGIVNPDEKNRETQQRIGENRKGVGFSNQKTVQQRFPVQSQSRGGSEAKRQTG